FLSGLILAWVSFPQHAVQGQVDPAILHNLGLVFVLIIATFSATAIAVLLFYNIDRAKHQKNIEQLESEHAPESDAAAKRKLGDAEAVAASAQIL
ncbi:MAG: hypothetical protein WA740_10605, partial [Candidatus Binataceae bacterium]